MQNVFIRKSLADKTVKLIGYLSCIACIYRISYQNNILAIFHSVTCCVPWMLTKQLLYSLESWQEGSKYII